MSANQRRSLPRGLPQTGFFSDYRIRILRLRHGAAGPLAFLQLLAFAECHRPNGYLFGIDDEALYCVMDMFEGDVAAMTASLVELELMKGETGVFEINMDLWIAIREGDNQ